MRTRRGILPPLLVAAALAAAPAAAPAAPAVSVKTLHFDTVVGPANDTHCDVIGDLYTPATATHATPAPAVLTTNGFGGSKDDQKAMATALAQRGYVVLSYSGLGFGGSGCKIELDDPDWDGKAGSQLVSFLGGTKAAKDGTMLDDVLLDGPGDPRVGMIGGSYGGQIQFSVAGQDPRVDTIVPIITWNDLAYSLTPNNTDLTGGVTSSTPGVAKYQWAALFSAVGVADGLQGLQSDPTRVQGTCPNFDDRVCPGLLQAATTGAPDPATLQLLRHASVSTYMKSIKIPTLLLQGQADTLFNLNEAIATYTSLKAQGTPVKMVWQSWGHSNSTPAPGELGDTDGGYAPEDASGLTVEGRMVEQWFDHYLKGDPAAPALDFSYFRDWVPYKGVATPAYGSAPQYPAGTDRTMLLSGTDALTGDPGAVKAGSASFTTPAAGAPTSVSEVSAAPQQPPLSDAPGTFAQYTGAPLAQDLDVVGPPRVTVTIAAPTSAAGQASPAALPALFVKVEDVAPDGTVTLPERLIAPIRAASYDKPVAVTLPAIVHRFAAGHQLRLIIAGSDAAYRGSATPAPITVTTTPQQPGVLTLPVVGPQAQRPLTSASVAPRACTSRRALTIHVKRAWRSRLRSATLVVGKRRVARITHGHRAARVTFRGRPAGTVVLRIVMHLKQDRTAVDVRRYRLCARR